MIWKNNDNQNGPSRMPSPTSTVGEEPEEQNIEEITEWNLLNFVDISCIIKL